MRKIREEVQSFAQSYTPHIVPAFFDLVRFVIVCLPSPPPPGTSDYSARFSGGSDGRNRPFDYQNDSGLSL